MRYLRGLVILVIAVALGSVGQAQTDEAASIESAKTAATHWLVALDAGVYQSCYSDVSETAKEKLNEDTYIKALKGMRLPLGQVKSRTLIRSKFIASLEGKPGVQGVTLSYETNFEKKEKVIEALGVVHDSDGQWRVGFYVTN
jgi:hypothetical protein